ncbi:hypothetical protein ACXZ1K_02530 [Pedobacter sp. PWIIR3]
MKHKWKHIKQVSAYLLLAVFMFALTPLSIFHNHHSETKASCASGEVKCMHKEHVKSGADNCVICALHFEKTYCHNDYYFHVFLQNKQHTPHFYELAGSYTELIGTSLRGPPLS